MVGRSLCAALLLAAAVADRVAAQEKPSPAAEVGVGSVGFADDSIVWEPVVGGSVRWPLTPRIGVGPEVSFIRGNLHSHLIVTGNITWDILSPSRGMPPRVAPFVVAGGGLFQTREHFPVGTFTSSEGAFTVGGGVRVRAGDGLAIGAEARFGWELHLRVSGFVSVAIGGR